MAAVQFVVTSRAQGDQIRILIRAPLSAQLLVMDLQILLRATDLACPVVSRQDLAAKKPSSSETNAWLFI